MRRRWLEAALAALVLFGIAACSNSAPTGSPPPPPPDSGSGRASHVFIVMLENRDYGDVIGNAAAPYLNGLAQQYALARQYYGVTHPSIGNYFSMSTGQIITNDDNYSATVTADNVVRRLLAAGKTWRSYAEDIPSVGYLGNYSGQYIRHHNPPAYFSDVVNSAAQRANLQPFSTFRADLAAGQLPDWVLIVPNACNDGHDCDLATADRWLKANIDPLIHSSLFLNDGVLVITFDEARTTSTFGGGRVAFVMVGPRIRRGYTSDVTYQHPSLLRFSLAALGVTSYPGAAATAKGMEEFFTP